MKRHPADLSLKGCQIVAGGRSVAQTTGKQGTTRPHPEGVQRFSDTLSGWGDHFRLSSGGLRYAPTTGYYLTAFQAGTTRYQAAGLNSELLAY